MCEETVKTSGPMRLGIVGGSARPVNRAGHNRPSHPGNFFVRHGLGLRFHPRVNVRLTRPVGAPARSIAILARNHEMTAISRDFSPVVAVALVIVFLAALKVAPGEPSTPSQVHPGDKDAPASVGPRLFRQFCVRCHGEDGSGLPARRTMPEISNFTSEAWQDRRSNAQLQVSILDGRGAGMPAFEGKIKPKEARAIVAHIRTLGGNKPPAAPENDFEERFRQLDVQMNELMRQFHELSEKRRRQESK
jgi:mono/diheme cytochrome c family protein